jgi:CheY-like chemotaxis protein
MIMVAGSAAEAGGNKIDHPKMNLSGWGEPYLGPLSFVKQDGNRRRAVGGGQSRERAGEASMLTIMLVEDNAGTRRLLKLLFEMEGYQVIDTDSYDEVVSLFHQMLPDAVLMDVQVHGRETIDLVRKMRTFGRVAGIPLVMTSAMDCRRECLEAGADQFILKPYLPDELVQQVGSLAQGQAADVASTSLNWRLCA